MKKRITPEMNLVNPIGIATCGRTLGVAHPTNCSVSLNLKGDVPPREPGGSGQSYQRAL